MPIYSSSINNLQLPSSYRFKGVYGTGTGSPIYVPFGEDFTHASIISCMQGLNSLLFQYG